MNKASLLAVSATAALIAGSAYAAPNASLLATNHSPVLHRLQGAAMLYNQNSNATGVVLVSQNFSSGFSTYDCAGADDFVVPQGRRWKIGEVDVTGANFNGFGPTMSENVTFYEDSGHSPGNPVRNGTFTDLKGQETSGGSFAIKLPKYLTLRAGTWWVSVVANKNFANGGGEWGWAVNRIIHGNPAMWENPGWDRMGGCPNWGTIGNCLGYTGDFMFDLKGRSL